MRRQSLTWVSDDEFAVMDTGEDELPEYKRSKSASPEYDLALGSLLRRKGGALLAATRSASPEVRLENSAVGNGNAQTDAKGSEEAFGSIGAQREESNTLHDDSNLSSGSEEKANETRTTDKVNGSDVTRRKTRKDDYRLHVIQLGPNDLLDGGAVFLLIGPPGKTLVLFGVGMMSVLRGSVFILGRVLDDPRESVKLYSHGLSPFLIAMSVRGSTAGISDDLSREPALEQSIQQTVLEKLMSINRSGWTYAIVRFVPLDSYEDSSRAVSGLVSQVPSPFVGAVFDESDSQSCAVKVVDGLFRPRVSTKVTPFRTWRNWLKVERVLSECKNGNGYGGGRILVCGDVGTGKSMAARCATNYLLNTCSCVIYVETDVGQPELMPPGFVSVHLVRKALIGPPSSHNKDVPIFSSYFGDITPRENVRQYALAVALNLEHAREMGKKKGFPIVCNSNGWISGIGGELLGHIRVLLEPTCVISTVIGTDSQCGTDYKANIVPDAIAVTLESIRPDCGVTLKLPRCVPGNTLFPGSLLREIGLCSYFARCMQSGTVYSVGLEDINIATIGEGVDGDHILGALNGSVIAIGESKGLSETMRWQCKGLGLVRAIDVKLLTIHISTPIPSEELDKCDCILMSAGVQMPTNFLIATSRVKNTQAKNSKHARTSVPYIMGGVLSNADAMRSRSNLLRR